MSVCHQQFFFFSRNTVCLWKAGSSMHQTALRSNYAWAVSFHSVPSCITWEQLWEITADAKQNRQPHLSLPPPPPVLTAISRGPKKAAASVLPERTKPACHPERVLGTKAAPFQGDEERQFQCPSQRSNLRKPTFDPRLQTFPKVLRLHAKILSGRHGLGRLHHKFL